MTLTLEMVSDPARFLHCTARYNDLVPLTITKDTPCLYITAVGKDRLPVFRTDTIKTVTCNAIDEARASCGFLLFAYVIMPDHFHVLTDGPRDPSVVLQYLKGVVSRRVLGYLRENQFESSLKKLQHSEWKRNHRYSLWQHDSVVFSITSESMFMQKVNYINLNRSGPDWLSGPRSIVGQAPVFGTSAQQMMNP